MRAVIVVPFDSQWSELFNKEKIAIKKVFGDEAIAIDHIGSTAITGMDAKPIIDILISAKDIQVIDQFNTQMERLGYIAKGEFNIPGRRFFTKDTDNVRTHHVHTFQVGDPHLSRHLAFRDYMMTHPDDAIKYLQLKINLAKRFPNDIAAYCDGKDAFIKEIDIKAAKWQANLM